MLVISRIKNSQLQNIFSIPVIDIRICIHGYADKAVEDKWHNNLGYKNIDLGKI